MEDTSLRDALQAYVGDGPPLSLRADTVLRAGRRSRRRMVTATVSAAAACVVLVIAAGFVVPALLRGPSSVSVGTVPVITGTLEPEPFCGTSPPKAPLWTSGLGWPGTDLSNSLPADPSLADTRAARLSCVVMPLVRARLAGFGYDRAYYAPAGAVPLQFSIRTGDPGFYAAAVVGDTRGVGGVGFYVFPADATTVSTAHCATPTCTAQTGPGGELVLVVQAPNQDPTTPASVNVTVYTGHTGIQAESTPYDDRTPPTDPSRPRVATRATPPLSVGQLIEIAASPALDVFAES